LDSSPPLREPENKRLLGNSQRKFDPTKSSIVEKEKLLKKKTDDLHHLKMSIIEPPSDV
jgi:hypothetical protein